MSETDPGYTDQQIRAIASALRGNEAYAVDDLLAADVIEHLYRERGNLLATLARVRHAVDVVARNAEIPAAGIRVLRDALDEVAW